MTLIILLLLLLVSIPAAAETPKKLNGSMSLESLYGTGDILPFWLIHNQNGKYPRHHSSAQVATFSGLYQNQQLFNTQLGGTMGFDYVTGWSNRFESHFNQLFVGLSYRPFTLKAGWFTDQVQFNGLSSSNGHIERSMNARPYPKIRFATNGFVPFFFFKDWFSYKAEYDEGWLGEERIVKNARLHHKSLYARFKLSTALTYTIGLNHYVYWGGISPTHGALPDNAKAYWLYITGSSGNEQFNLSDQMNVAGNQLGAYYMELALTQSKYQLTLYYSHPFEDHSGMEMDNWRDNLLGLFINFNKKSIINNVVYEFMYTIHQSGDTHLSGYMRGRDNYFNHGDYRSGHTYKGYAMSSPLFSPLVFTNGVVSRIENTRLAMHHLGFSGTLHQHLQWRGLFTYSKNLGTYDKPYTPAREQLSALLAFNYRTPSLPFDLSLAIAADLGSHYPKQIGAQLKISTSF